MEEKNKLLFYALKYKGDWDRIITAINFEEEIDKEEFDVAFKKMNCKYITILDPEYPSSFKHIHKPPLVLFYYGDLSLLTNRNLLGIVGSRHPTNYGKNVCEELIGGLEIKNVVIVSGLAKGIDSIAHKMALRKKIKTIAILGVGIDYCYPKENFELYNKIKEEGLIISEYPYKEVVCKKNFPLRNRLVAALSDVLFIPDVKEKSGTQITIRFALEEGKDILVVPSSIFEGLNNNFLISQGAIPVMSSKDIEEYLK